VNGHFHKDWDRRVKTWFNQPGRKDRRRRNRARKAARIAPRPVDGLLRPAVRCPTLKYNLKLRAGRGFTLEELKAAGVARPLARTIGIAVDHRRRNKSQESLALNVRRLRAYRARLIVFPRRHNRVKDGDSKEKASEAKQLPAGTLMPISQLKVSEPARKITDAERKLSAFATLRMAWADNRVRGRNEKRQKRRAEEEANKVTKK